MEKQIDKFPYYTVNSDGLIFDIHRTCIPQKEADNGYLYVGLANLEDLGVTNVYVHELVAKAFVANPFKLSTVEHINGFKHDNRAVNLKWTGNISKEGIFMNFALSLALLSKCTQRGVAAVCTDANLTQVYSIGINGGAIKGIDCLCALPGKETCIHAETACIAKAATVDKEKIMFVTLAPCVTCASLMVNTGFTKVYYHEDWKDNSGLRPLIAAGITTVKL